MEYQSLRKLYYTDPENYESTYSKRYNSDAARHFPIEIREINRGKAFPAFLCYTGELNLQTQRIYQKYIHLERILENCPGIMLHQYALSCLIEEVQSTNEIEGVKSTKKQIKDIIQRIPVPENYKHLISVVDKYHKIINKKEFTFDTCEDIRKFYDGFALAEVVQKNPHNAPDGTIFRKSPVEITSKTNKARHEGIMPESSVIENMNRALNILHDETIPFLVRISAFHYFFEYIHPFYDGNGRTGRFIVSYYLAKEFNALIALRLSVVINKDKKTYYRMFEETDSEFNRGDQTPFVTGFMGFIEKSMDETISILSRKKAQLVRFKNELDKKLSDQDDLTKSIYFILLQASLFSGVGVTMMEIMNTTGKTRATIKNRFSTTIPTSHYLVSKEEKPFHYRLNMSIFKD